MLQYHQYTANRGQIRKRPLLKWCKEISVFFARTPKNFYELDPDGPYNPVQGSHWGQEAKIQDHESDSEINQDITKKEEVH